MQEFLFENRLAVKLKIVSFFSGVRAFNAHRHAGHVAGGIGDWSRVHVRHAEASADDHLGGRKNSHPNMSELARHPSRRSNERSANVGDRF